MPGFASQLSDQQVADLANYVRSSWGNGAAPNTTSAMSARLLRSMGYPKALSVAGGFQAWKLLQPEP